MLLLYLLFLIAIVFLASAAVYVKGARTGKDSVAGPTIILLIGGAETFISCFICMKLCYADMSIFTYIISSVILYMAVYWFVDKLLKPYLRVKGSFNAVKRTVMITTAVILLSCPAWVGVIYVLDNSYPGADSVMQYSDYASEDGLGDEDDALAYAMQDTISDSDETFYDEMPEPDFDATSYEEPALESNATDGEPAFAPGISDWSGGKCYFAGTCGFRLVDFFINDGDRCIRVTTSPADMFNMYAYTGTSDGWHRFRKYRLVAEAPKMETKDLSGNPMTIKIPVIAGSKTKYRKEYLDGYVFIAEDAREFIDDESFPGVDKNSFWTAWNGTFGENWPQTTGGGGSSSAASQDANGSTSDYSVGKCKYCGGNGKCSTCGGSGFVDFMGDIQKCPSCRGFGKCFNCGGSGLQI